MIIWENENYIALDKPSGALSIPGRDKDSSKPVLLELAGLKNHLIIHRLDFEVSGIMIIAKNANAHQIANAWFENKEIQKTYQAWTECGANKISENEKFHWESNLLRGKKRAYESPNGKPSITDAEFKNYSNSNDLKFMSWLIYPKTGRSHQIRFELYKHGFPILGDTLYGSKTILENKIALRAIKLDFTQCEKAKELGLPESLEATHLRTDFLNRTNNS